jgi:hypothetical protein
LKFFLISKTLFDVDSPEVLHAAIIKLLLASDPGRYFVVLDDVRKIFKPKSW